MRSFEYTWFSEGLVKKLADHVLRGESVLIIGYPNSGKRLLCDRLAASLQQGLPQLVVRLDLSEGKIPLSESQLTERLAAAVKHTNPRLEPECSSLLQPLRVLPCERPTLIAGNIDGLPYPVARAFLQECRTWIDNGWVNLVLTGEYNLEELVHGPNSAFEAAHKYVLQGFERESFNDLLRHYEETFEVQFTRQEAQDTLFRLSGGNGDVLWGILRGLAEACFHEHDRLSGPVSQVRLAAVLAKPPIRESVFRFILRHIDRTIPVRKQDWRQLQQLIETGEAPSLDPAGPPNGLVLSGVASKEGSVLKLNAGLMKDALCSRFTPERWGDLYVQAGDWPRAKEWYQKTEGRQPMRPVVPADQIRTETLLHAFRSLLQRMADQGRRDDKKDRSTQGCRLFADFCRLALRIPQVSFWRKIGEWKELLTDPPSTPQVQTACREILAATDPFERQPFSPAGPWKGAVAGILLQGIWSDQPFAVLVGDFQTRHMMSVVQEAAVKELLGSLGEIHNRIIQHQREQLLLGLKRAFDGALSEILSAAGARELPLRELLAVVARRVRPLGYRRLFFSLVDPAGERIVGMHDESDDPTLNLAARSVWDLKDPKLDIQPYVVNEEKDSMIVSDASTHPLTCKETVKAAQLEAFALIPLIAPSGAVTGTLHLERQDKSTPSTEEVDEFQQFGRTLAAMLEQERRLKMMQSALNLIQSPVVLADARGDIRYCNKATERFFPEMVSNWWHSTTGKESDKPEELRQHLRPEQDQPIFKPVTRLGKDESFRGWISVEAITDTDWGDKSLGSFLHVEDHRMLEQRIEALRKVAAARNTDDALKSVLEAFRILGHRWGRLYRIEQRAEGERLVGVRQFSSRNDADADFPGTVLSNPRGAESESWLCFTKKRPVVLCCTDRGDFQTPLNVEIHGVVDPKCAKNLAKNRGDCWIDFPLYSGEREVGKITFECTESIRPERFAFICAFCEVCRTIIEGNQQREYSMRLRETERALAKFAHTVATRWTGFRPVLSFYRSLEGLAADTQLKSHNDLVARSLDELDTVILRAKENLRAIKPVWTRFCLRGALEKLGPATSDLEVDVPEEFTMWADPFHVRNAIAELVNNAYKMQRNSHAAFVRVSATMRDGKAVIAVEDGGPGVREDVKGRLFSDFESISPDGGNPPGIGLGLGLVRRVMEAHGGSYSVTNRPEGGARFELAFSCSEPREVTDVQAVAG